MGIKRILVLLWALFFAAEALSMPEAKRYEPMFTMERYRVSFEVRADGAYEVLTEVRMRINTPQGVRRGGSRTHEYIASLEDVLSVEAATIQPDGRVVPVPESAIRTQDEQADDEGAEFSDTKIKVIIFSEVAVGSSVWYRIRVRRHTPHYPGQFQDVTTFSRGTPYEDAELSYAIPASMPIYFETIRATGGLEKSEGGMNHYRFRYRSAAPIQFEAGLVALADYGDHVRISSYPDMPAIGRAYQETAAPKTQVTDEIRRLAVSLTEGAADERERVRRLYNWVAMNIRYVAVALGSGRLIPHEAQQVLQGRYGDCKDHVALLEALLSAVGIASSPALVSLGNAYTMARIGLIAPLNHVITYVPSLDLYLDATDRFTPFGQLSFGVLDKPTVLAALGRLGRTPKMDAAAHRSRVDYALRIDPDGQVHGASQVEFAGVPELESRRSRFGARGRSERQEVKDLLLRFNETGEGTIDFPAPERVDLPYWIRARFRLNPVANMPGRGAMMLPIGLGPGTIAWLGVDEPLGKPFDFPCRSHTAEENYTLDFPDNVTLDGLPAGTNYRDSSVTYESTYAAQGRRLTARRRLIVQRPGSVCSPADQERWRAFHKVLQRDLRGQIFYK